MQMGSFVAGLALGLGLTLVAIANPERSRVVRDAVRAGLIKLWSWARARCT